MFDLLMFDLIISLINGYKKQNAINEKIIKTANKLKKQTSIPQVKEKMNVLQKISQKDYQVEITPVAVDKLREEIRDLMQFLAPESRAIIYTKILKMVLFL